METDNATVYGENQEMILELLKKIAEFNGGKDEIAELPEGQESDSGSDDPRLNEDGVLNLISRTDGRAPSTKNLPTNPLSPVKVDRENTIKA